MILNKELYNEIKMHCKKDSVEPIDNKLIEAAANALHLYNDAVKKVSKGGELITEYESGSNISGLHTLMQKQLESYLKLSQRLGLDPDSRAKIQNITKHRKGKQANLKSYKNAS